MTTPTRTRTRYIGYRFPAEIISHAVWLYFPLPPEPAHWGMA